MEEGDTGWTVKFLAGEITGLESNGNGEFIITGKKEWWNAVFNNRIDAFLATQQGKLKLMRGELAQLSRWYKPFQRAFALWQTIPIQWAFLRPSSWKIWRAFNRTRPPSFRRT